MTDLSHLKLIDLLPSSITGSEEVVAIAQSLDQELQAITACINEVIMLPRIDELPEDTVDHLAGQLHVDYYEPLGLDLAKKRALVKSSLSWHRRKGTKSVLKEIIQILFLDDFEIEEWYEYGGEPYFFRIIIHDPRIDERRFDEIIRAVYELKNVRSWLEAIILRHVFEGKDYIAGALADAAHEFFYEEIEPPTAALDLVVVGVAECFRDYFGEDETPIITDAEVVDIAVIAEATRVKFFDDAIPIGTNTATRMPGTSLGVLREYWIEENGIVTTEATYHSGSIHERVKEEFGI